jgi:carbon-monoxide dehydrogenase small subunit
LRRKPKVLTLQRFEGLGSPDGLHVLQEMFKEHHGLQCGYCTPE